MLGSVACLLISMMMGIAAVGMLACGGGSDPAVDVAGRTISAATIEHWTPIEAVLAYTLFPTKPVPRGLIPDPPAYTACIAYLQHEQMAKVPEMPVSPGGTLKQKCRERYENTRRHIIDFLITLTWLEGEATERGWNVTSTEVTQDLQHHINKQFGSRRLFARYLKYTGLTMADELLRFRNNLLTAKLEKQVLGARGLTKRERVSAYQHFLNKWVARTHCRPGYIAPDCSEYKGPFQPGF
jgi:foldase protein PrsA